MSEYPEGRTPLTWQDMPFADKPKGHPSTFEAECKQLRAENERLRSMAENYGTLANVNQRGWDLAKARVAELEAVLTRIKNYTGHPTATTQTDRNVFAWSNDALRAAPQRDKERG